MMSSKHLVVLLVVAHLAAAGFVSAVRPDPSVSETAVDTGLSTNGRQLTGGPTLYKYETKGGAILLYGSGLYNYYYSYVSLFAFSGEVKTEGSGSSPNYAGLYFVFDTYYATYTILPGYTNYYGNGLTIKVDGGLSGQISGSVTAKKVTKGYYPETTYPTAYFDLKVKCNSQKYKRENEYSYYNYAYYSITTVDTKSEVCYVGQYDLEGTITIDGIEIVGVLKAYYGYNVYGNTKQCELERQTVSIFS